MPPLAGQWVAPPPTMLHLASVTTGTAPTFLSVQLHEAFQASSTSPQKGVAWSCTLRSLDVSVALRVVLAKPTFTRLAVTCMFSPGT